MNDKKIWIAVAAFALPILARLLWFYPGISIRPEIATPEYAALTIPLPPLETPAAANEVRFMGGTVIVDYTHTNQFQPAEIDALVEQIEARGGRAEFISDSLLLENSLKYASAYLVLSPSMAFTAGEINLLRDFVGRGGRLAVFTDATRGMVYSDFFSGTTTSFPDVYAVNPLLANFGITVNADYLYDLTENEGNFRNVFFNEFGKAELTFGLKRVAMYGSHSVKTDEGTLLFLGAESTLSSTSDAHDPTQGGAAINRDGNVLALGDFTFLTHPYNQVADNATLISNISDFLLGGNRTPALADFPYVFNGGIVQVKLAADVQMTAEMIGALSRLQASMRLNNTSMQIVDEEPAGGDVVLIGTFDSIEELGGVMDRFDLVIEPFSDYVTLPGFGNVGRYGNAVLLMETRDRGNTLVLLASTMEDLTYLLDTLSGGSLYSCVIQGQVGVCSIGYGGSFSDGSEFDNGEELYEEASPEPQAEPTTAG